MKKPSQVHLSRRERQIMDVIYQRGRASAAEVLKALPDAPSNSAVRALLRILEEKGHLRHQKDGPRYMYIPVVSEKAARRSALKRVLNTFFHGSTGDAMAALISMSEAKLSDAELDRLASLVEQASKEGR